MECVEKCAWEDVREKVYEDNEQLALILDAMSLDHSYEFFRVRYQFGEKVYNKGHFSLPQRFLDKSSYYQSQLKSLKEQLSYSSMPVGLILTNGGEVYYEDSDKIFTTKFYTPGSLIGLWETLDHRQSLQTAQNKVWSINSGARSIFMLPKISDYKNHRLLKAKYKIRHNPPRKLLDHYHVFRELINNYGEQSNPWYFEVLFFGKKFLESKAAELKNYWLETAWEQSMNTRSQMSGNIAWEKFASKISRLNIRPKHYLIQHIKHIINVSTGMLPGLTPSFNELAGPISLLKNIYLNDYKLLEYTPIIFTPYQLKKSSECNHVYHSLTIPNLTFRNVNKSAYSSYIAELRDLKEILEHLEGDESMEVGSRVNFDCFHTDGDESVGILPSREISKKDEVIANKIEDARSFAHAGPLISACIKITKE